MSHKNMLYLGYEYLQHTANNIIKFCNTLQNLTCHNCNFSTNGNGICHLAMSVSILVAAQSKSLSHEDSADETGSLSADSADWAVRLSQRLQKMSRRFAAQKPKGIAYKDVADVLGPPSHRRFPQSAPNT